jgi:hypothetical protein
MPMDPDMVNQLSINALRGVSRQSDQADQANRDSASLLLFDHRSLSAAVAREVAMAPNSQDVANLNTAIRTPNTIDHYALGAGPAAPGAPGGAAAAKTA